MGLLVKILVSAVAVIISAYLIPGVSVDTILTAVIVAIVLGLLNAIVKPILVILTIPVTIITLGLFLLVINVIIIYLTDYLVPGFSVTGFIPALLFSIVLAIVGWILNSIF
jgi:putative membrane protein